MRNVKKVLCALLALMMVLSLAACKQQDEDAPVSDMEENVGLGDMVIVNSNTVEHTKDLGQEETLITKTYSDLGMDLSEEELDSRYMEYVAPIKDLLRSEGLFTEMYDDTNGSTYRALQAFDPTMRYVYNLFCHVDGYQGVRMAVTLYKAEHPDWDEFDYDSILEQIKEYTGIVIQRSDFDIAQKEILERVEDGKGFQVYIQSEKGERTACLSVMEFGTEYECWTIDVFNLVTPGANFYGSVDEDDLSEDEVTGGDDDVSEDIDDVG